MNILKAVKKAVTVRQAAEYYGLQVNRAGMCRCPFHNDHKPSMKVDTRFHCFGCGADGDVIRFAEKLFGLSDKAAARKLAKDFGIRSRKSRGQSPKRRASKKNRRLEMITKRFIETEKDFYIGLTDYYHTLRFWKEAFAPVSPDDEWDDRFCEALLNLTKIEYVLDCYLDADTEEKIDIMKDYGGMVLEHKRRNQKPATGETGPAGGSNGCIRPGGTR